MKNKKKRLLIDLDMDIYNTAVDLAMITNKGKRPNVKPMFEDTIKSNISMEADINDRWYGNKWRKLSKPKSNSKGGKSTK